MCIKYQEFMKAGPTRPQGSKSMEEYRQPQMEVIIFDKSVFTTAVVSGDTEGEPVSD